MGRERVKWTRVIHFLKRRDPHDLGVEHSLGVDMLTTSLGVKGLTGC